MRPGACSDFSFRVLMPAALRSPEGVTVDEVADTFGISRPRLEKRVHGLGRNGYLRTRRGIGGGFTLARPPEKLRLEYIIRLGEESDAVIDCADQPGRPCRLGPACRLKAVLDEAAAAFIAVLDGYSRADLVKPPTRMRSAPKLRIEEPLNL